MKRKKQNMDNEGQSQNAEAVQSTGDNKIIFECSHPNSADYVRFRVEPTDAEHSLNGLYCNLSFGVPYIVYKHNLEKNHVLTHKKYEITLKEWLVKNSYNWSTRYKGWGVNRPTEKARKIIQGILNAVHKLHKNRSFHGFLHHLENFVMDSDELVIGGYHKKIKHISLIHANVKGGRSVANLEAGMKNDIQAMSNVIFDEILKGESDAFYPPDLKNLHCLLQNATSNTNELGYIVNHPSLWHWKSRFSYIVSVYMDYQHADPKAREQMTKDLNWITVKGWRQRVALETQTPTPLGKIFLQKSYGDSTYDLLRYLRNAHVHYKENKRDSNGKFIEGEYIYIDRKTEGDYLNEKFFELKTNKIGGLFLVDLYYVVRDSPSFKI